MAKHTAKDGRVMSPAAVVALFLRWIRAMSTSLFPMDRLEAPFAGGDVPDRDPLRHFAKWFVTMRWVACAVAAAMIVASTQLFDILDRDLFAPLAATLTVLFLTNIVYALAIPRAQRLRALILVQVYADLVLLVALLHFSGGIENPLHIFLIFHVIISGILLRPMQCYVVAAAASFLFVSVVLGEWGGWLEHTTLRVFPHDFGPGHHGGADLEHAAHFLPYVIVQTSLFTTILFLTAYFITSVVARLRTEQERTQWLMGQARAEKQRLEKVVDAAGAGLLVTDATGAVVWINDTLTRWAKALGSSGAPSRAAVAWVEGEDDLIARSIEEGGVQKVQRTLAAEDGSLLHFQVSASPVQEGSESTPQSVVLIEDITELVAKQEQLIQTSKLASIGELAGRVAHDINNPTAVISTKARLLLSDSHLEIPTTVREDLQTFVDLSDRITRIAHGLLSYSRPSTGDRSVVDIRNPLLRALSFARMARRDVDVQVVSSLPPQLPAVVGNAAELEQVFVNLIANALDAMPTGGVLTLEAEQRSVEREGQCVAIVVGDSGTGIPADLQRTVFEPFVTTKQSGSGTGLGLAICAGIVRSHGGWIEAVSQEGQGTRILVWLPAAGTPEMTRP